MLITKNQAQAVLPAIEDILYSNSERAECQCHWLALEEEPGEASLKLIRAKYDKQIKSIMADIKSLAKGCYVSKNEFNYSKFLLIVDTYLYMAGYPRCTVVSLDELHMHNSLALGYKTTELSDKEQKLIDKAKERIASAEHIFNMHQRMLNKQKEMAKKRRYYLELINNTPVIFADIIRRANCKIAQEVAEKTGFDPAPYPDYMDEIMARIRANNE